MNSRKGYFSALHSMRGIAALGVVFFHSLTWLPQVAQQVPASFGLRGYLWVDFFFVLSGFVLAHSNAEKFEGRFSARAYRSFLAARFARIYPAYFIVLLLFVLLEAVAQMAAVDRFGEDVRNIFFSGAYSVEALMSNILLLQSTGIHDQLTWNMPGWSLSAEWLVYLFVPLIFYALFRCGPRGCLALLVVSVSGLVALQLLLGKTNLDITYDFGVMKCLLEVLLGYALYRLHSFARVVQLLRGDRAAAISLVAIPLGMLAGLADIVIVGLFAVSILSLSLNEGWVQRTLSMKPLLLLGTISYSIYLIQWLIFRSAKFYLAIALDTNPLDYFSPTTGWYFVMFALLSSTLMGGLLYWWVERPMHARVRRGLS